MSILRKRERDVLNGIDYLEDHFNHAPWDATDIALRALNTINVMEAELLHADALLENERRTLAEIRAHAQVGLEKNEICAANRALGWIAEMAGGRAMRSPQEIVDEWNERYPVGTLVKYRPILGGPVTLTAKTEHPAQLLGGHTPTLWLVGHLSAYAISHCEPVGGDQ